MIACRCGRIYRLGCWDDQTEEEKKIPEADRQNWNLKICPRCRVSRIEKLRKICEDGVELVSCGVEG